MRSPGEPRRAWRVVIVVFLLVAAGSWWWSRRQNGAPPATATLRPSQQATASASVSAAMARTPARLAVAVSDEHGPLASAMVRLVPSSGEVVTVPTGADGVAHADLAPGAWRVSASAPDHLPAALPMQQLAAGDVALTLRLAPGGRTLRGTISDATGGPIAGARIDAARLDKRVRPGEAVSTTMSGADGSYRLTVAEGTLLVAAASSDYVAQSRYVEVGAAGAVADFALVPGGVIEGIVRDERSREPVAGASVTVAREGPATPLAEPATRRAVAGGDGRFRIGGLRPGAWQLAAQASARRSKAPTVVGLGVAEQVSDVELLVASGAVLRGRVVDEGGGPAAGATVDAFARGERAEATADATGAFAFEALAPGSYGLIASGNGYLSAGRTSVAVADRDIDGIVVTTQRGIALRGHVEPRQPCDIEISADQPRRGPLTPTPGTASDADGNFALGPVLAGPIELTARCASGDQGAAQVTAAPAMADVILKVAPGASIAGRVLDDSGKPVAGAGVMASEITTADRTTITNGMITSGVHGLTDASGAYQLDGLSPGNYRVRALDRGKPLRPRTPPPTVALAVNEHRTGVDLAVDRSDGVITGTVTGPDGKPLADAWVSAQEDTMASLLASGGPGPAGAPGPQAAMHTMVVDNDGGGDAPSGIAPAFTDAQGHYELRGLPHAVYTVAAEAQRGDLRAHATGITPDATVNLQTTGVTTLSGHVTGPAGPVAAFSVELDGPTHGQRSFTDGSYSFGRVDPGNYTVRVEAADGNAEGSVTVVANQPAMLDLALVANGTVVGRLIEGGKPVAGQPLTVIADSGDGRLQIRLDGPPITTGIDGSFRITHAPGPCSLVVMQQRPFVKRGMVLEAGKTLDLGAVAIDSAAPPPPGPPRAPAPAPPPAPHRRSRDVASLR